MIDNISVLNTLIEQVKSIDYYLVELALKKALEEKDNQT